MKIAILFLALASISITGCQNKPTTEAPTVTQTAAMPAGHPPIGDAKIEYPSDVPPMKSFTSKTLNKTFDTIYFIQGINIIK